MQLGRLKGIKSSYYKLTGKDKILSNLSLKGLFKSKIAKILNVHRNILSLNIKNYIRVS